MALILVVEDDSDVRQTIVDFLYALGHEVLPAGSAEEARRLLASHRVALVLADCMLQGEPGPDLAEHSRDLGVPAILTTGDPGYLAAAEGSPFAVLAKPFRLEELESRIAAALQPSPA